MVSSKRHSIEKFYEAAKELNVSRQAIHEAVTTPKQNRVCLRHLLPKGRLAWLKFPYPVSSLTLKKSKNPAPTGCTWTKSAGSVETFDSMITPRSTSPSLSTLTRL